MPIRAELRHHYRGAQYEQTRTAILDRAKHKCEQCGKPNHISVFTFTQILKAGFGCPRIRKMYWIAPGRKVWRDEQGKQDRHLRFPAVPRKVFVVLTVAHLNHIAGDDRPENLKALCTWCHLNYDQLHHHETRSEWKDLVRPILAGLLAQPLYQISRQEETLDRSSISPAP